MWLTRSNAAPALALVAILLAAPGAIPPAVSEPARTAIELLALDGFDPVSYFLPGGPRAGTARFELTWGGRVWRFASGADRAAFRENPEVYAPRLGGYDAAAILDRVLVDADPLVFAVIGERLYLFRDAERRTRFLAEPGLARQAEAIWPSLHGQIDRPLRDAPR